MLKNLMIFIFFFSQLFVNVGHSFCLQDFVYKYKPLPGLYIGGMGGFNGGYDLKCSGVSTNRGYYLGAKLGKKIFPQIGNFFPHLRVEGEFVWQRNSVHSFKLGTIQLDHTRGHVQIWSLMTNLLLDLNCDFPVRPFLGGGVGYAQTLGHWSALLIEVNGDFFIIEKHIHSKFNKSGFATQVIAGLKYFICPNLEVSLEYRFFHLKSDVDNHKLGLNLTKFF